MAYLETPVFLTAADPNLAGGWWSVIDYDSVAAFRYIHQRLRELLKMKVSDIGQYAYVVASSLVQTQTVNIHKVVLR